ncbi:MAG: hypothetical protein OEY68_06460 [Gammaproteobacteria bacterium]|nr:hypothetical protein [Gammaproteobacteria bacterium]
MFKTVTIPIVSNDKIVDVTQIKIYGNCPVCGGQRGQSMPRFFWEENHVYECDGWENPCGHIDYYEAVRNESEQIHSYQSLMDSVFTTICEQSQLSAITESEINHCKNMLLDYLTRNKSSDIQAKKAG